MNVALAISSLSFGGAQRVVTLLANHWVNAGHRVSLITLDTCASDCYALDPRVRRFALGLLADSNGFLRALVNNWRRIKALRAAMSAAGARVALSFEDHMNVVTIFAARSANLPVVISVRIDPARNPLHWTWAFVRRLTYPLASALVVQTRALAPWGRTLMLRSGRTHVIPNPVRIMQCCADSGVVARSRVITAVGRLVPDKGYDIFLMAFASIARHFPAWRVVLVGEGPERAALERLAQALGIGDRVTFPGWLAEPGEVLGAAGLFVVSSLHEGFPNALLEAMACGLPVISTRCLGPAEIISPDMDGVLVSPGSVDELAAAMGRLLADDNLRAVLGGHARAVSQRYALEPIVRRWDALLQPAGPAPESPR